MAILEIARLGNPILRAKASPVAASEFGSEELETLISNMFETMYAVNGVGLAAPQVSVSKQLAIIEFDPANDRYDIGSESPQTIFINPVIEVLDDAKIGMWEGCLSVPGLRGYVERPRKIQVTYQTPKKEEKQIIAEDFLAIVIQHELDHLDGSLYVDKLVDKEKFAFCREYEQFWITNEQTDEHFE